MEMRVILARMVLEFDWELLSRDVDWEKDNTLKMLWQKPELRIRFTFKPGYKVLVGPGCKTLITKLINDCIILEFDSNKNIMRFRVYHA
jgi:hypothetical protein